MADFKTRAGNIQDEPGIFYRARKLGSSQEVLKNNMSQSWNKLNNKIILAYTPEYKMDICKFILTSIND